MDHATRPPTTRTGKPLSGVCRLPYGHLYCSPGPVLVRGVEVLPRRCYCSCHKDGGKQ